MDNLEKLLKEFDKKDGLLFTKTTIKSFIAKVYEQTRQEALEEADKLIGQAHSDGFREGKQEMIELLDRIKKILE